MAEDDLFGTGSQIKEGERLILDIDPVSDRDRGVTALEADRIQAYENVPVASEDSGNRVGTIEPDEDGFGLFEETMTGTGRKQADINDITATDRRDLDPVGIGRDNNSGKFTPDNVEPAPFSPSDRDPDDGEFVTPDPEPVTDIGRKENDGLFDLF